MPFVHYGDPAVIPKCIGSRTADQPLLEFIRKSRNLVPGAGIPVQVNIPCSFDTRGQGRGEKGKYGHNDEIQKDHQKEILFIKEK
jgi:hypothetical protein